MNYKQVLLTINLCSRCEINRRLANNNEVRRNHNELIDDNGLFNDITLIHAMF